MKGPLASGPNKGTSRRGEPACKRSLNHPLGEVMGPAGFVDPPIAFHDLVEVLERLDLGEALSIPLFTELLAHPAAVNPKTKFSSRSAVPTRAISVNSLT